MAKTPPKIESFTSYFEAAKETSARLMVILHGLGDSLDGFRWFPGALSLGRQNYLMINAPLPYDEGFAWYEEEPDPVPDILRGRARLGNLLAELTEQGWEGKNIVLLGFSQGCLMATDFALRYEKPLLGVIGISGYIYFPNSLAEEIHPSAKKQAWLITHGKFDTVLPPDRTRKQISRLSHMGIKIEWAEFHKAHAIDAGDELALIRDWIFRHGY